MKTPGTFYSASPLASVRATPLFLFVLLLLSVDGDPVAFGRTIDGTENHLTDLLRGSAGMPMARWCDPDYGDGMNAPGGSSRPNPRALSNALSHQTTPIYSARGLSDFVWQWGQFLDHDISLALTDPDQPMTIPVTDPNDALFPMIPTSRTAVAVGTGTDLSNPREQSNAITAYIDGSMVYGSDSTRAAALRTYSGGLLATTGDRMLPKNTAGLPNANDVGADPSTLYLAGDIRANENVGLTAMHTLFVREHNRLATELAASHPSWDDEMLYERSRKLVGAQIQAITYHEFLPALLGAASPAAVGSGYDENADATIANEFATAFYRLGHSMVNNSFHRVLSDGSPSPAGDLPMKFAFFNPDLMANSSDVDQILKGLTMQQMQEVDLKVVGSLRNNLFGAPGEGGLDLVALNIMRGRDHGLADFNTVREQLGLGQVSSFMELTGGDAALAEDMAAIYEDDISNVDLWVGLLAEPHLPGASVGRTLAAGLFKQFSALRDGDRYYFEYDPAFSLSDLEEIRGTTLADVIMRNTSLAGLQGNVFFAVPEPTTAAGMLAGLLAAISTRRMQRRLGLGHPCRTSSTRWMSGGTGAVNSSRSPVCG